MGMRGLGELNGRKAGELLRCSNIGAGTIVEIQRLIERASHGEFKSVPLKPSAAPAALLSLTEAALSSLIRRDRDLLLDWIGARGIGPVPLEQLARDYRLSKERVRQIREETLIKLKKAWGPRIPHLLATMKTRCVSMLCPLSPELLEHWIRGFDARLQLEAAAHVRLIGALDRQFPCWLGSSPVASDAGDLPSDFIRSLLAGDTAVRLCDAYHAMAAQRNFRALSFGAFLQMLARISGLALHFDQPEAPVLYLRRPNEMRAGTRPVFSLRSLPTCDRSTARLDRRLNGAVRPAA
jgi:hypothetical protein